MKRKTVFITGAAKGIGASIALKMASLNYNVVINYLTSEDEAHKLKKEIENKYNVDVMLLKGDITNVEVIKKMINEIILKYETIDALVNNACICPGTFYKDKTKEEFRKVLDVNLVAPFLFCQYVSEVMLMQKSGVIINISSTNGIDTVDAYSMDYDASKAGLISLTHNFAQACAPFVRVIAVAPGWVETESVIEMNPTFLNSEKDKCLLNRFGIPKEIANVVAFLISDDASYINDTVIRIDGGKKV